jgi:hypothetical protein
LDAILVGVGVGPEQEVVAFAAADVLLAKVRTHFSALPEAARTGLRDALLRHIPKFLPAPGRCVGGVMCPFCDGCDGRACAVGG